MANTFVRALANGGGPKRPTASTQRPGDDQYDPQAAAQARQLFSSAFADSMYAIAGRPARVAEQFIDNLPGAVGEYRAGRDSIAMSPAVFRGQMNPSAIPVNATAPSTPESDSDYDPAGTFAHELAHRMFWRAETAAALRYDDPQPGAAKLHQQLRALDTQMRKAGQPIPGYAGTNADEHAAEAVRNAVQFLRATDRMRASPELAQQVAPMQQAFESAVPGTTLALNYLMTRPIYQGHPLVVSRELKNPAPDATAVNPSLTTSPTGYAGRLLNLSPLGSR